MGPRLRNMWKSCFIAGVAASIIALPSSASANILVEDDAHRFCLLTECEPTPQICLLEDKCWPLEDMKVCLLDVPSHVGKLERNERCDEGGFRFMPRLSSGTRPTSSGRT